MILAINVENTHTLFGVVEQDGHVRQILRLPTDRKETSFGYASRMKQVLELVGISNSCLEGAILSSVVPPLTEVMKEAVSLLVGRVPMVVGSGVKTGLHIRIDDPGSAAADLVAMAIAAKEEYALPCVIVYFGTATTITTVDAEGRFIGGAILPGVESSLDALAERTSLLPKIDLIQPKKAIASSTVECMRSGVLYGTAGAVDGILDRFAAELGAEPATVVLTGEIAETVSEHLRHDAVTDSTLLLKGLGILYRRNQK